MWVFEFGVLHLFDLVFIFGDCANLRDSCLILQTLITNKRPKISNLIPCFNDRSFTMFDALTKNSILVGIPTRALCSKGHLVRTGSDYSVNEISRVSFVRICLCCVI